MNLFSLIFLQTIPEILKITVSKGNETVEKPVYVESEEKLYINKERFFSSIPKEIWEFHIGGYQVLDKYLKSRKGRILTLDESNHVKNIVNVLGFTIQIMKKIDDLYSAF